MPLRYPCTLVGHQPLEGVPDEYITLKGKVYKFSICGFCGCIFYIPGQDSPSGLILPPDAHVVEVK